MTDQTVCYSCGKPHRLIDKDAGSEREMTRLCLKCFNQKYIQTIKRFRKRRKLSQADLAGLLEVSLSTVRKWEQGITPVPGWTLKFLSLYLRVKNLEKKLEQTD